MHLFAVIVFSYLLLRTLSAIEINYLIVAGGGAGGGNDNEGSGGGGGGVLYGPGSVVTSDGSTSTSYFLTVGAGGTTYNLGTEQGANGIDSTFFDLIAYGGGGGGGYSSAGKDGGSGGGGGTGKVNELPQSGGEGTPGQGNNGADGQWLPQYNGGGGGAGGTPGSDASLGSQYNYDGSPGILNNISGSGAYYGGGGAGSTLNDDVWVKGTSVYGSCYYKSSGGGGQPGHVGCPGVVIISFAENQVALVVENVTSLTYSLTNIGGNEIWTFNVEEGAKKGSANISFTYYPTTTPTSAPTMIPSMTPSSLPSSIPSAVPSVSPSLMPSSLPSSIPSVVPSVSPSLMPSSLPSSIPSAVPSSAPSRSPSALPSSVPTSIPSSVPTNNPSASFCPAGTRRAEYGKCVDCAAGYYSNITFLIFPTNCTLCPSGTYSLQGSANCTLCGSGLYQTDEGTEKCKPCQKGYYCPPGCSEEIPCDMGTYNNLTKAAICNNCTRGYFQDVRGQESCKLCPIGQYCENVGTINATNCPSGSYSSKLGSINCDLCLIGEYQDMVGQASCKPCSPGYFCNTTSLSEPFPCLPGTHNEYNSSATCNKCMPGTYQQNHAQYSCDECPAGQYCPDAGMSESLHCLKGTSSTGSAILCSPCQQGFYQDDTGESSCIQCPTGRTTQRVGSTTVEDCISVDLNIGIGITCTIIAAFAVAYAVMTSNYYWFAFKSKNKRRLKIQQTANNLSSDLDYLLKLQVDGDTKRLITKKSLDSLTVSSTTRTSTSNLRTLWKSSLMLRFFFLFFCTSMLCATIMLTIIMVSILFGTLIFNRGSYGLSPINFGERLSSILSTIENTMKLKFLASLLYPFKELFALIADINLDLLIVNVTCKGVQAPVTLILNAILILLTSYIIASDFALMTQFLMGEHLCQSIDRISTYGVHLGKKHSMYILIGYVVNTIIVLNPVRPLLQYSFGLMTVYKFVEDHGAHAYTPSCDAIKGFPNVDITIAYMATIMFWFTLPNIVYTFAKVLVPGGDDHLHKVSDTSQMEDTDPSNSDQQQRAEKTTESHTSANPILFGMTGDAVSTTETATNSPDENITFNEKLVRKSRRTVLSSKARKLMTPTSWIQDALSYWFQHFAKVLNGRVHEAQLNTMNHGDGRTTELGVEKGIKSRSISSRFSTDEFMNKENAMYGTFPKFNTLCLKVHREFIDNLFPVFGLSRFDNEYPFLRGILVICSLVMSISTCNHLFTSYGRKMWYVVLEKYYVFGLICMGIWNDRCYECFKGVFEENLGIYGHIFAGREHVTFSYMLYTIVMPRAIFLLIVPQMTAVSLYCSCTCRFPILVQNKEMKMLLGQLLVTNSVEQAYRSEISYAASSYTPRERLVLWKIYIRSWEIYLTESRLFGYLVGCIVFVSFSLLLYAKTNETVIFMMTFFFIYSNVRCLSLAGFTAECLTGINDDDFNIFFGVQFGMKYQQLFDRIDAETVTVKSRGDKSQEMELTTIVESAGKGNSSRDTGVEVNKNPLHVT